MTDARPHPQEADAAAVRAALDQRSDVWDRLWLLLGSHASEGKRQNHQIVRDHLTALEAEVAVLRLDAERARDAERDLVVLWLRAVAEGHPGLINPEYVRHYATNIAENAHRIGPLLRAALSPSAPRKEEEHQ